MKTLKLKLHIVILMMGLMCIDSCKKENEIPVSFGISPDPGQSVLQFSGELMTIRIDIANNVMTSGTITNREVKAVMTTRRVSDGRGVDTRGAASTLPQITLGYALPELGRYETTVIVSSVSHPANSKERVFLVERIQ